MRLAGATGIFRPDFTDPTPELHLSIEIEATRASVFRTLIEPALVNQWFGTTQARVVPASGGEFWLDWEYKVDGPRGDGTRMRFVHGGCSRTADLGDYPFGWVEFLDQLKQVTLAQDA